jgi:hypothetical protein
MQFLDKSSKEYGTAFERTRVDALTKIIEKLVQGSNDAPDRILSSPIDIAYRLINNRGLDY